MAILQFYGFFFGGWGGRGLLRQLHEYELQILLILLIVVAFCAQAPKTREIGPGEPDAVQSGGADAAGGQPQGQTAARQRRALRPDILLPSRVRLPAETVAEEAVALTTAAATSSDKKQMKKKPSLRRLIIHRLVVSRRPPSPPPLRTTPFFRS